MMGLLHISIFMGHSLIIPGRLHCVVLHECLIANCPVFFFFFAQLPHCSSQVISAMLFWNATDLPESFLDPLGQGLEGFAEADTSGFHVGIGQHKVVDHVREWFTVNSHTQILHMGEVGLGTFARLMALLEDDLLLRPMHSTPAS